MAAVSAAQAFGQLSESMGRVSKAVEALRPEDLEIGTAGVNEMRGGPSDRWRDVSQSVGSAQRAATEVMGFFPYEVSHKFPGRSAASNALEGANRLTAEAARVWDTPDSHIPLTVDREYLKAQTRRVVAALPTIHGALSARYSAEVRSTIAQLRTFTGD